MAAAADSSLSLANIEDSLMILQLMRDDLILWHGEMSKGKKYSASI